MFFGECPHNISFALEKTSERKGSIVEKKRLVPDNSLLKRSL
jgi:hypothetical protein